MIRKYRDECDPFVDPLVDGTEGFDEVIIVSGVSEILQYEVCRCTLKMRRKAKAEIPD